MKIVENSHGYDTGYTMTPSASSYALQNPAAMHTRSASHSPSNPSDACDSDDDDMTILVSLSSVLAVQSMVVVYCYLTGLTQ